MGPSPFPMSPLRLLLGAFALASLLAVSRAAAPSGDGRELINLDKGWRFLGGENPGAQDAAFDDGAWRPVDLPHTWNAEDGQEGGGYRRGAGWYRRHLQVPAALCEP